MTARQGRTEVLRHKTVANHKIRISPRGGRTWKRGRSVGIPSAAAALETRSAPFLTGEVSLPFLAGLLLPALGFLCHCLLSPPSSGFTGESALGFDHSEVVTPDASWLPPGTRTLKPALFASGHLPRLFSIGRVRQNFLTSLGMA